jgi:hypothetical protein
MTGRESTQLDDKVVQVFLCHRCDPQIYMKVKFNAKIACMRVAIVCPYCGHHHPRTIKHGQVVDDRSGNNLEEILVPKSACTTTDPMAGIQNTGHGNGNVIPMDAWRNQMFRERWFEKAESEKGGL